LNVEPQYTQFPVLHAAPYQEQHIPVYEPQLTVPALSSAPGGIDGLSPASPGFYDFSTAVVIRSHGVSGIDTDLDCPQSLMHRLQQYPSSTTESALPACPQFHPLQNQFPGRTLVAVTSRSISSWFMCTRVDVFVSTTCNSDPCLTTPRHSAAPECQRQRRLLTTSIQIPPLSTIKRLYFGLSQQLGPANPARSSHAECISTGDMSLDENHNPSQPVSADHMQMEPIDSGQNVHQPQTLPVSSSDHQPEVVPRLSAPVDTVKAKAEIATSVFDLEVTNVINFL
jgi:hypothetical protein